MFQSYATTNGRVCVQTAGTHTYTVPVCPVQNVKERKHLSAYTFWLMSVVKLQDVVDPRVENDASARPPNLSLASRDLDV